MKKLILALLLLSGCTTITPNVVVMKYTYGEFYKVHSCEMYCGKYYLPERDITKGFVTDLEPIGKCSDNDTKNKANTCSDTYRIDWGFYEVVFDDDTEDNYFIAEGWPAIQSDHKTNVNVVVIHDKKCFVEEQ